MESLPGYALVVGLLLVLYTPFLYTLLANLTMPSQGGPTSIDYSMPHVPTTGGTANLVADLGALGEIVLEVPDRGWPRKPRIVRFVVKCDHPEALSEGAEKPLIDWLSATLAQGRPVFVLWDARLASLPSPFLCWYFARTTYGWMETQQANGFDIGSVFVGASYLMPRNAFGKLATSVVNMASTLSGCTGYVITFDDGVAVKFLTSERDALARAKSPPT